MMEPILAAGVALTAMFKYDKNEQASASVSLGILALALLATLVMRHLKLPLNWISVTYSLLCTFAACLASDVGDSAELAVLIIGTLSLMVLCKDWKAYAAYLLLGITVWDISILRCSSQIYCIGSKEIITCSSCVQVLILGIPLLYGLFERFSRIRRLSKQTSLLKGALDAAPIGLCLANRAVVAYCNRAAERLLTTEDAREEKGKKQLQSLLHEVNNVSENWVILGESFKREANKARQKLVVKIALIDTKGKYRLCMIDRSHPESPVTSTSSRNPSPNLHADLHPNPNLDLTHCAANERQRRFVAMAVHDLRNPLQGVIGLFEAIVQRTNNPELKQYGSLGITTGHRMMSLVNDLLDVAQLQSGHFKLRHESFDPLAVIQDTVHLFHALYLKKGVTLACSTKGRLPKIEGDSNRYRQVLVNLLGNALKFTERGSVEVKAEYDASTRSFSTEIQDTGKGIGPEDQKKLFAFYGKLDTFDNPHGVGLGLVICKQLTEAMGGTISLKSVLGHGTTFCVRLPAVTHNPIKVQEIAEKEETGKNEDEDNPEQIDEEKKSYRAMNQQNDQATEFTTGVILCSGRTQGCLRSPLNSSTGCPPKLRRSSSNTCIVKPKGDSEECCDCPQILVVDDEFLSCMVVQKSLEAFNYSVETANSGEKALELMRKSLNARACCQRGYSLVLIDINMPGLNGLETTKAILEVVKAADQPPPYIVGMSGDASAELQGVCIQSGMDAVSKSTFLTKIVEKPLTKACLQEMVRDLEEKSILY